jgi:uncharacterized protein YecE (DUF72 family)
MALGQHIRIGTSGWSYPHWRGIYYPDDLPGGHELAYYVGQFGSVEINSTFYRLPARSTLERWRERAPDDFVFAVKASRYITHMKKLRDPKPGTSRFLERIDVLGRKLGPLLFQLPPKWRFNEERLAGFLESLPAGRRYAFEFRDRSWLEKPCFALLERHGAALCVYDLAGYTSPTVITADFAYVRLHGPGAAYEGCYDKRTLSGWARAFSAWSSKGLDVYCYFDNDQAAYAARNALTLKAMLAKTL